MLGCRPRGGQPVPRGEEYAVVNKRSNPYARAYSFGTDGSAALAGSPIASHRPIASPPKRSIAAQGIRMPRWVVLAVLAGLVLWMGLAIGDTLSQQAEVAREIDRQHLALARAQQTVVELDEKLVIASDETRIRTLAVNRLQMQMPTAEQIYYIPAPQVASQPIDVTPQQAKADGPGFFRLMLSMFGL